MDVIFDISNVNILALTAPTDLTFTQPVSVNCTTVQVSATGAAGTLTYEITDPATAIASNATGLFPNLAAGTYIFKVTDANGCYFTKSYTVKPIAITGLKIADVLCKGNNTGAIKYTVSNYIPGTYSYSVNGVATATGQNTSTIDLIGLAAGSYTVTVTDDITGCTDSETITITEPINGLSASYTTVNANCNMATSTVTVTPVGGTPNYTYSFVLDNAAAGVYGVSNIANLDPSKIWDVWVKDVNGCPVKLDLVIAKNDAPTVTASVADQCNSTGGNFVIKAVPGIGSLAPLTYSIDGVNFQSSDTFTVTSGSYTVIIKDKNGCTNSTPITVNPQLLVTSVLTKDLDCIAPNAIITVEIVGGKGSFSYKVKKGSGSFGASIPVIGTSFIYPVLPADADSYIFEITDANNCVKVSNLITINPILNLYQRSGCANLCVTVTKPHRW